MGSRIFEITPEIKIVARTGKARDGFNHFATLYNRRSADDEVKVHYINRTWESYEFQSVLYRAVEKSRSLSKEEKEMCNEYIKKDHYNDSDQASMMKTVSMVASLGDIFGGTQKEKNDWKARMLKAGLGNSGLEMPDDWDTLSEAEKERRLNGAIKSIKR